MFLSDRIYEILSKSNPKNNLSQAEAVNSVIDILEKENVTTSIKSLMYSTKNAVDRLQKEGRTFFKMELFFNKVKS